jgi:hypothetical protein
MIAHLCHLKEPCIALPEVDLCICGTLAPRPYMATGDAVPFLPLSFLTDVDALSEGCRGTWKYPSFINEEML